MLHPLTPNRPLPPIPSYSGRTFLSRPPSHRLSCGLPLKSAPILPDHFLPLSTNARRRPPPPPLEPPPPVPVVIDQSNLITTTRPTCCPLLVQTACSVQKPRPRVPRMGTGVAVGVQLGQTQTTPTNTGSKAHTLGPRRSDHVLEYCNPLFNNSMKETTPNANKPRESGHKKLSTLHHLLLATTRHRASSTMSPDWWRIFQRYTQTTNRLTPIRERVSSHGKHTRSHSAAPSSSNASSAVDVAEITGGVDASTSTSEYSDETETTNLSLTWPLSRSQTDVSHQLYRSTVSMSTSPIKGMSELNPFGPCSASEDTKSKASSQTSTSSSAAATDAVDVAAAANPGTTRLPEDWMRMVDTEDILRRLKRIRIVALTAKRWRIKRRPDGTRYLAYCRRSHRSYTCSTHRPDKTNISAPQSQQANSATIQNPISPAQTSTSPERTNRRRSKSQRSPPSPPFSELARPEVVPELEFDSLKASQSTTIDTKSPILTEELDTIHSKISPPIQSYPRYRAGSTRRGRPIGTGCCCHGCPHHHTRHHHREAPIPGTGSRLTHCSAFSESAKSNESSTVGSTKLVTMLVV